MTEIVAWCPKCHSEGEIPVTKITIVNNVMTLKLECGHELRERFRM